MMVEMCVSNGYEKNMISSSMIITIQEDVIACQSIGALFAGHKGDCGEKEDCARLLEPARNLFFVLAIALAEFLLKVAFFAFNHPPVHDAQNKW